MAGVLLSRLELSTRWLRTLEFTLFIGLTAIIAISEYTINVRLLELDEYPAMIAFVKNGVIQMVVLMLLYGTFIPNRPRTVAWVVLVMAPVTAFWSRAILTEHPDAEEAIAHLRSAEQTGTNALFLFIAAGMAIYGSAVLNGLRRELHVARKFGRYRLVREAGGRGDGRGLPGRAQPAQAAMRAQVDQAGGGV